MLHEKKIIVVLPAYRAEKTLAMTYREIPFDVVDEVVLVDDKSSDKTVDVAKSLGIKHIIVHEKNLGYGGNQKSCYAKALSLGADIVVMVHPDYQYSPKLITAMAAMITSGHYDVVLGSRILGKSALSGGMPFYKYIANRFLTFFENILLGLKLSEYHTGYRAFSRKVLETLPLLENSDDFIFDNQMLTQTAYFGFNIGEISCPTKYFDEASSIGLYRSIVYGLGVLKESLRFRLQKIGIINSRIFFSNKRLK